MSVTAQSVQFRDEELRPIEPASLDRLRQLGAVIDLSRRDFDELGRDLPVPAVEEGRDGRALRFDAEAAGTLAIGADAEVQDERSGSLQNEGLRLRHLECCR